MHRPSAYLSWRPIGLEGWARKTRRALEDRPAASRRAVNSRGGAEGVHWATCNRDSSSPPVTVSLALRCPSGFVLLGGSPRTDGPLRMPQLPFVQRAAGRIAGSSDS